MANSTHNLSTASDRITAFFPNSEGAYRAVSELKNAGFSRDQIGLAVRDDRSGSVVTNRGETTSARDQDMGTRDKSFWQDVKDFFSGSDTEDRSDEDYRDSIRNMGWDENRASYYEQGIQRGGAILSVTGPRVVEARVIIERFGGDLRESGFDATQATSGVTDRSDTADMDRRIQLRGELLNTYKERVRRGEVRLRKEVVTEHKTIDVPVTREELVIERTSPTTDRTASGEIGSDQEIRVPLEEERVRVQKQQVVNEEVRVGKRQVQRNERVSDDVRHEELKVEKEGEFDVTTEETGKPKRKKPAA